MIVVRWGRPRVLACVGEGKSDVAGFCYAWGAYASRWPRWISAAVEGVL